MYSDWTCKSSVHNTYRYGFCYILILSNYECATKICVLITINIHLFLPFARKYLFLFVCLFLFKKKPICSRVLSRIIKYGYEFVRVWSKTVNIYDFVLIGRIWTFVHVCDKANVNQNINKWFLSLQFLSPHIQNSYYILQQFKMSVYALDRSYIFQRLSYINLI